MASYTIDPKSSRLVVTARSSVHDTDTTWTGITGSVSAEPGKMSETSAAIEVDMSTADAGDWLKNRKLRKDMNFDTYPTARFELTGLRDLVEEGEKVTATVEGTLSWRNKSVQIEASGQGSITDTVLVASGRFDLDVTKLGVTPPKILMIKVQDVVSCSIKLTARVA